MIKPGTFCCAVEENRVQKKGKRYVVLQPNWRHRQIGRRRKKKKFQPLRRLPKALGQMVMSPRGCFVSQGAQVPVKTSETRQS